MIVCNYIIPWTLLRVLNLAILAGTTQNTKTNTHLETFQGRKINLFTSIYI